MLSEIVNALARGETVKLPSFGTFSTRQKHPRLGRNFRTGQTALISARTIVVFRPSQALKMRVQHALKDKRPFKTMTLIPPLTDGVAPR